MGEPLAIEGGRPVRSRLLPYGRQTIDDADVAAVVATLRSDWLTTGPAGAELERPFADFVSASYAGPVSSGTAALHAAAFAAGIGPGDEAITTPLTFVATSNAVLYQGGRPVFADIDPEQLTIAPESIEPLLTRRTKAIMPVHYAG